MVLVNLFCPARRLLRIQPFVNMQGSNVCDSLRLGELVGVIAEGNKAGNPSHVVLTSLLVRPDAALMSAGFGGNLALFTT